MARWRQGVSKADGWEREWLLGLEQLARRDAVEIQCLQRCAASAIGIADCSDVIVRSSAVQWFRAQRRLYVRVRVITGPHGHIHVQYWRTPVRGTNNRQVTAAANYLLRNGL